MRYGKILPALPERLLRKHKGYRVAQNLVANCGWYVRPDDNLNFSPSKVYSTPEQAWDAWEKESR